MLTKFEGGIQAELNRRPHDDVALHVDDDPVAPELVQRNKLGALRNHILICRMLYQSRFFTDVEISAGGLSQTYITCRMSLQVLVLLYMVIKP